MKETCQLPEPPPRKTVPQRAALPLPLLELDCGSLPWAPSAPPAFPQVLPMYPRRCLRECHRPPGAVWRMGSGLSSLRTPVRGAEQGCYPIPACWSQPPPAHARCSRLSPQPAARGPHTFSQRQLCSVLFTASQLLSELSEFSASSLCQSSALSSTAQTGATVATYRKPTVPPL